MTFLAGQKLRAADLQALQDSLLATDAKFAALLTLYANTASVATNQTTTSSAYTDLGTVGPAVTLTSVGTRAFILWSNHGSNDTANAGHISTYAISGDTTLAAGDTNGILWHEHAKAGGSDESSQWALVTITPGSNTYTMKYKRAGGAGTASFERRRIMVFAP